MAANGVDQGFDHGALRVYETMPDPAAPLFLFVHGGPGSHCHYFKHVVAEVPAYRQSGLGWIFYDQRGCGKASAVSRATHHENVEDLRDLIRTSVARHGKQLAGIVGHSYGGWLAYDAVTGLAEDLGLALPPVVLLSVNVDRTISRNRNFMIEMIEAKIRAAGDYQTFLSGLPAETYPDAWREKDRLRAVQYARDLRKFFYWANLDAMTFYGEIKAALRLPESDEIFVSVRDTFFEPPIPVVDIGRLPRGSLRIVGFQDFMMAGEATAADQLTRIFLRSGHYPHIEQPDEFLAHLRLLAGRR